MKTFLFFSIFITSLLYSNTNLDRCENDIQLMMKHSYTAEKALHNKNYFQAENSYNLSIDYSNRALLSCQNLPNYDFNLMYNYIVHSENEINKINNIQASAN